MTDVLERPIRVVYFAGPYLEPSAVQFIVMLHEHPDIDLVLGVCQGAGSGLRYRLADVWRRRRLMALPVLMRELATSAGRLVRRPRETLNLRRRAAPPLSRFITVPDVHAPAVLERVRESEPDLGVVYGAPILKPELFEIPPLGTLGIHHGRAPAYRGKKTTFWEMYNGERAAGVTIQRVNPGIDTGEIVRRGEVEIGRKGYGQVCRELDAVGRQVYLEAILDVRRGSARFVPQDSSLPRGPLYRQPGARDILRFWVQRLTGRRGAPEAGAR